MVPLTASEPEAVSTSRKESGEGKGDVKRRVVDDPAMVEEGKAYPLAWDVVKGVPTNMNWEQLYVLDYTGLEHLQDPNVSVDSR